MGISLYVMARLLAKFTWLHTKSTCSTHDWLAIFFLV